MSSPLVIRPRAESVEGQPILRPLPSAQCRSVGPFVFFDHMLETDYAPGHGMDIRQHPHIGLSTLTYLFEGAILPVSDSLGVRICMIAGSGFCLESPVPVLSPTLYAQVRMQPATTLLVPNEHDQRALYLLDGELMLNGEEEVEACSLLVLPEGEEITLYAEGECQLVLIGGAPLDGPRRMNWNFVASDPELIEQARAKWAAGDWPVVPGEISRIELPR